MAVAARAISTPAPWSGCAAAIRRRRRSLWSPRSRCTRSSRPTRPASAVRSNGRTTCSSAAPSLSGILLERAERRGGDRLRRQSRRAARGSTAGHQPRWPCSAARRRPARLSSRRSPKASRAGSRAGAAEGLAPVRARWLASRPSARHRAHHRASGDGPVRRARRTTARCGFAWRTARACHSRRRRVS